MVAVPFGLDQPYNAHVLARRDLAEILLPQDFSEETFCGALTRAIERWPQRRVKWMPWLDDGASANTTVDQIEGLLHRNAGTHSKGAARLS